MFGCALMDHIKPHLRASGDWKLAWDDTLVVVYDDILRGSVSPQNLRVAHEYSTREDGNDRSIYNLTWALTLPDTSEALKTLMAEILFQLDVTSKHRSSHVDIIREIFSPPPKELTCWKCRGTGRQEQTFVDHSESRRGECTICQGSGVLLESLTFDPAWRTTTVVGIAQRIDDTGDFDAMPILADALEEAGCEDERVLRHCKGGNEHLRGCWVVDLILGNE